MGGAGAGGRRARGFARDHDDENHEPEAETLLRLLFPHTGQAYSHGSYWRAGTGKSTLVDRLASYHARNKNKWA